MTEPQLKPPAEWTNKNWRNFMIFVAVFGLFMICLGARDWNVDTMKIGLAFIVFGILGALLIHMFFGIKTVSMRTDVKHVPRKK
jgi:hypothetical protein